MSRRKGKDPEGKVSRSRKKTISWKTISLEDLAGYVAKELRMHDIDVILVGGSCATLYSKGRCQSYDLDFVTYEDIKKVKKVMQALGLSEKNGYFQHEDCPWFIEFVSPPVAIGNEPVHNFNYIDTSLGKIKLLTPNDSVKDRLASFYHWNDEQALQQAIDICKEQMIDLEKIKKWSFQENMREKFQIFYNRFNQKSE